MNRFTYKGSNSSIFIFASLLIGGLFGGQGPVVQSIVSLTSSLRDQLVKCFTLTKYTDIFVKKLVKLLQCESFSQFFNTNIGVFQILTFEILTKRSLTTSLIVNNQA